MRTTLNLDDDVAAQLSRLSRREARSMSRIANDLIRLGLRGAVGQGHPRPYDPPVFDTGDPLLDVTDVAGALELLDLGR